MSAYLVRACVRIGLNERAESMMAMATPRGRRNRATHTTTKTKHKPGTPQRPIL